MTKNNGGRKQYKPTNEQRALVQALASTGIKQDDIALVLNISKVTLNKYYRAELDTAAHKANAKVAQSLYNQAISGNTAAAIFWLKIRAGWTEKSVTENINKNININNNVSDISDDELDNELLKYGIKIDKQTDF